MNSLYLHGIVTVAPIIEFLSLDPDFPILDVRSPGEYHHGHIPGALSFPLFDDEERAVIGTLYKQVSREKAIQRGKELAEPKIPRFIAQAEELGPDLRLHCWRGGMRSQAMAELLEDNGHRVHLLEGGYKAYRQYLMQFFSSPLILRVLTGHTGSMKTEILLEMRAQGQQVVDLEGAANHQGSSFGNAHTSGQPATEHFQNLVFEQARHFDRSLPIWIEDESFMIGKCAMIQMLFDQMQKSPHIEVDVALDRRLDHLVSNYGEVEEAKLIAATDGIRSRLGNQRCDTAIQAIREGDMRLAASLALYYYDKQYAKTLAKKQGRIVSSVSFTNESVETMAAQLLEKEVVS